MGYTGGDPAGPRVTVRARAATRPTPPPVALAALWMCVVGGFATGCQAQEAHPLVLSSDPALAAIAEELLPDLARRSGMELREPVRVERRTRQQLIHYLEHKIDEDLPPDEARAVVDAYALLGLVPPDLDLRAVLLDLYTEQVSGFYEPDSTALFVMDDQAEADVRGLLVHELVHAVQDQTVALDELTDPDRGSDRATAAQAAIEGHATLVMFEYMAEEQMGSPVDLSTISGLGPMLRQNLQGIRTQFPALAKAPPILQETLIFPYLEGAVYLQGLWSGGRRVVPFGDNLPFSTEQILEGASARPPLELEIDVQGGEVVREEVLGRLELGVVTQERVGPGGESLADGWDGDRYVLVESAGGRRALAAWMFFDDTPARDRFVAGLTPELAGFGGPATLEAVAFEGHPGAHLTIGDLTGVTARVVAAARR